MNIDTMMARTGLNNVNGPAFLAACPVHGELVATTVDGKLLGRCSECWFENAQATRMIREGEWDAA